MGFVELPKTKDQTITEILVNSLTMWKLDLNKWHGKGFDGAATMSGELSGVHASVTALFPKAKYSTPLQKPLSKVFQIMSDILADLPDIDDTSDNDERLFQDALTWQTFPTLSNTGWSPKIDSINTLFCVFENIYDAVSEIKYESTRQSAADDSTVWLTNV